MANDMYTRLFKQVNKLFKEDYLLKDNVPIDISAWIDNHYNMRLEGKVLIIDAIPDLPIYIIKDKNVDKEFIGMDIILSDNKPCKVIVISKDFLDNSMEFVQKLLVAIYNFILSDLYSKYSKFLNSLHLLNTFAPYVLTINTMTSFGLSFYYEIFDDVKNSLNILKKSCDYNLEELLDAGLILKLIDEETTGVEE